MRAALGSLAIIVYLTVYIVLVVTLVDFLPGHWAVQLVFFTIAGVIWVLPLKPVLRWAQGDHR